MKASGDFVFPNRFGGIHWEILNIDGYGVRSWFRLPVELSGEIEKGRSEGRRMIFMKDEQGQQSRCFLDNHEESLARIGGSQSARKLRRRELPPIVLPSEIEKPPRPIRRGNPQGKARQLSVLESYARAKIVLQAAELHNAAPTSSAGRQSLTDMVQEAEASAKKAKKKKRRERREAEADWSLRPGSPLLSSRASSARRGSGATMTGGSSSQSFGRGVGGDDDEASRVAEARFALSFKDVENLPQRPKVRWVLEALFLGRSPPKPSKDELDEAARKEADALRLKLRKEKNGYGAPDRSEGQAEFVDVVARNRFEEAVLWQVAKKRRGSRRGREKAATELAACWRSFKERELQHSAARRIQRFLRARALLREAGKWRKSQARKRKKALKAKALLAAKQGWAEAQKGVLVAIDLACGQPLHRVDWLLRSRYVGRQEDWAGAGAAQEEGDGGGGGGGGGGHAGGGGGVGGGGCRASAGGGGAGSAAGRGDAHEAKELEKLLALRALVPGEPKSLKNIMLMWDELHVTKKDSDLALLKHVPPPVLAAILPAWRPTPGGRRVDAAGTMMLNGDEEGGAEEGEGATKATELTRDIRRRRKHSKGKKHHDRQEAGSKAIGDRGGQCRRPEHKKGAIPLFREDVPAELTSVALLYAAEETLN